MHFTSQTFFFSFLYFCFLKKNWKILRKNYFIDSSSHSYAGFSQLFKKMTADTHTEMKDTLFFIHRFCEIQFCTVKHVSLLNTTLKKVKLKQSTSTLLSQTRLSQKLNYKSVHTLCQVDQQTIFKTSFHNFRHFLYSETEPEKNKTKS